MSVQRQVKTLTGIQVLRALAASLVMAAHISDYLGEKQARVFDGWIGGSGVDIFFVISGFIMARLNDNKNSGIYYVSDFMVRRISRIAPAYWLTTALVILFWWATRQTLHSDLSNENLIMKSIRSFLFMTDPIVAVGWTLTYEMLFYAIMGASMLVSLRYRIAGVSVILVLVSLLQVIFNVRGPGASGVGSLPLILEFLIGIGCHRLTSRWQSSSGIAISIFLVGAGILLSTQGDHSISHGHPLWMAGSALIVLAFVWIEPWIRWPKILAKLGDASYCIYLINLYTIMFSGTIIEKILQTYSMEGAFLFIVASSLLTWSMSLVLHARIEKPLTNAAQTRLLQAQARLLTSHTVSV